MGNDLGLTVADCDGPIVRLDGPTPQHTIWINRVPEQKAVKNRVHLDVHAAGPDALTGAEPVSGPQDHPWRIMADPDGGEFCSFTRKHVPSYRLYEPVVDAADPAALAPWWATVFGARHHRSSHGWQSIDHIPGLPFESIVFNPVPERKTVKNRVHWDITAASTHSLDTVQDHGARIIRAPDDDIGWSVMTDPEGNEFCLFPARAVNLEPKRSAARRRTFSPACSSTLWSAQKFCGSPLVWIQVSSDPISHLLWTTCDVLDTVRNYSCRSGLRVLPECFARTANTALLQLSRRLPCVCPAEKRRECGH